MVKVKRALISVSDKKGLLEFARGLKGLKVEIISTGGTAKELSKAGIKAQTVESITDFPEILNGRIKTLHPKIHAGILALRDNPVHSKTIKSYKIQEIDLVVVNLYPFKETIAKKDITLQGAIEQIDIGGVALIRSAAKNFKFVAVVCNPDRYESILAEMREGSGSLSDETLQELAIEAFKTTQGYDSEIYKYLKGVYKPQVADKYEPFPEHLELLYDKLYNLRYGENPHQRAAFYKDASSNIGLAMAEILGGKELSFNNILDLDTCLCLVSEFSGPCACIIKHTSPCGAAQADTLKDAYNAALECDRLSAYGGVVGLNGVVDEDTAALLTTSEFIEAVVALGYTDKAVEILKKRKNLRIVSSPLIRYKQDEWKAGSDGLILEHKFISGGCLLQEKDTRELNVTDLKIVTKRKPTNEELKDLLFAWKVVKFVKSNAIVIAKDGKTVGIGAGQPSRVGSAQIAISKAGPRAKGAVLSSDAFFPRRDGVDVAAKAGLSAIIHTGGSIRDNEVIQAADEAGIAMLLTGIRHFRH